MPKKTIFEASAFAKLLSVFYDKKAKGQEDDLEKKIAGTGNKDALRAYKAWKGSSEDLLNATKRMLAKSNLDTTDIDNLLKKYHNY